MEVTNESIDITDAERMDINSNINININPHKKPIMLDLKKFNPDVYLELSICTTTLIPIPIIATNTEIISNINNLH